MNRYQLLIFDADHTLLDYLADERAAFVALYNELKIEQTDELLARSRQLSESEWTNAGMYDVHDPRVQKSYHRVYREHVTGIFEKVFEKFGAPKNAITPKAAGEKFLRYLERKGKLFPYAEETLSRLSQKTGGKYRICIATNGLSSIQRGRLSALEKYVHAFYISEEVGAIKPLPEFFSALLQSEKISKENCLMIGDSLHSDIAGAKSVGMDCCWLNSTGMENDTPHIPNMQIHNLFELVELL